MVPRLRGRSFVAYTWGSPSTRHDRHDKTRKAGKSPDFSLKTDMSFRLLAPTQSGTIPDGTSQTRDLATSIFFSNCDSQRPGNYLWISLRRSHSSLARCQP